MEIAITNSQKKIRLNQKRIRAVSERILKQLKQPSRSVLSLSFVSKQRMRALNKKYFKKNSLTDVIGLGYEGSRSGMYEYYLGDILICPEVASDNSKIYSNPLSEEIKLYVVHGMLHLLGYDDGTKESRGKMRRKEMEVLKKL